ncbi:MAG TPA: hypothetical protein VGE47_05305 [Burkholderiaceae bacterium]
MRQALIALFLATISGAQAASAAKQMERLDRGVVALSTAQGVFLSWRLLGTEAQEVRFNVYRDERKLNAEPQALTNFVDAQGSADSRYMVRAVVKGKELPADAAAAPWATPFMRVPIQKPADGITPDGVAYGYQANDGAAADLDGDGCYELIVKWQPTNAKDNSQKGYTGNSFVDAYKMDGTRLWRIDLGRNIRAGAHYTSFLAYDFDGDGKAEVMMKTADGTVDGLGRVIGDAAADHRNEGGYVLKGPEFLTVFNGLTGAAMASTHYLPARGEVSAWGDAYGNRVDRFLAGVAYLDGVRPSAVFSRGYYTRAVLAAWDWRDGKLSQRWIFDSDKAEAGGAAANHQGAHWFSVADVDGDGRDDIIYGAATIGSDGRMLYSTGLCHGDALHVGKLDPDRPGQQIFMVHETPSCYGPHGLEMHDGASGKILWSLSGENHDVGRGICMDIDPAHRGEECWGSVGGLMSAGGKLISDKHPDRYNSALWWDGDLLRESLDGVSIDKWSPAAFKFENLLRGDRFGAASNNGSKANPVLSADLFGDWREEVVWRNADSTALLIFTTTAPTSHRITTLMHNPQYRVQVAAQNAGYNQPPHPSFYLGEGMQAPEPDAIYTPAIEPAPRPLYRDPKEDGAADVALIFNRGLQRWEMFYTVRRATLRLDDPKDVSWVHGTAIGIAATDDGNHWTHAGTAQFPSACTGVTQWAPEILEVDGTYHLWLTIVPGIHRSWTGPRYLEHLTSTDLREWHCAGRVDLGSERVIDASVVRLPERDGKREGKGGWRLWYKDEAQGSRLMSADSADLEHWTPRGPVTAQAAEGPKVFRLAGKWWLVADMWKGLLVLRSDDAEHWEEQPTRLLTEPGTAATDRAKGQHPDVQVLGDQAYLFYFVHQGGEDAAKGDDRYHQRSVIQVAELRVSKGWLEVDRKAPPPDMRGIFGPALR